MILLVFAGLFAGGIALAFGVDTRRGLVGTEVQRTGGDRRKELRGERLHLVGVRVSGASSPAIGTLKESVDEQARQHRRVRVGRPCRRLTPPTQCAATHGLRW